MKRRTIYLVLKSSMPLAMLWVLLTGTPAVLDHKAEAFRVTAAGANGAALYNSKCALCHARNGAGTPSWKAKGQPDLTNPQWQAGISDEQIAASIRNGKGKMPANKKLSDEEVRALVMRVRAFRR